MENGFFPFDYFHSLDKLHETELPSHNLFYSEMKSKNISDEECIICINAWKDIFNVIIMSSLNKSDLPTLSNNTTLVSSLNVFGIGRSQPMQNDQTYFFSDIFLKLYYIIKL